ncbi:MAG TPA: hypoxanthine-guanine phosphoribosyltransferase [Gammaproteobacteria bacterium]|nr:hypoxanthine-guanine phosphoribosyltransferase [Gammaproteobacteria bacterium]
MRAVAELDAAAARRDARRLYSAREIDRAIKRMAADIESQLAGKDPVVLAVMHGGAFAAVELCRHFTFAHEFDYVHVTRYRGGTAGGDVEWRVRPSASLAGRTVLVVDDILDRGHTLAALGVELERIGVAAQFTAVLVVKRVAASEPRPRVDFAGVEVDDVYVFGCGMDYHGHWRGLKALYALNAPDDAHDTGAGGRAP